MDTGEFIALDHPFTEGNKAYRKAVDKMQRVAKAMIEQTAIIHRIYHRKVRGGWKKCSMLVCKNTQLFMKYEGIELE